MDQPSFGVVVREVQGPPSYDCRQELGRVTEIVYSERRTDKPEIDAIDEAINLLRDYKRRIWGNE